MKLCPQCDFIYEDDQSFCDMDGKELVYDPAPNIIEQSAAIPSSLPPRSQSRRFVLAASAGVALTALLFVGYFARTNQSRSGSASQSSNQSTPGATTAQSSTPDLVSVPSAALAEHRLPEQPPEQLAEQAASSSPNLAPLSSSSSSPLSSSSAASFRRARLGSSPVSAGGSPGNRAPVIVRLSNGASIKADEAWERKEGIWYRQAGMVTFLKRSRVRAIERLAYPQPRSKSGAVNADERNQESENFIARNQPRLGKPEVINVKKESGVRAFLKKTGRILKKPFKF